VAAARRIIAIVLLALPCTAAFPAGRSSVFAARAPTTAKRDVGLIFNTEDILFDVEGFQNGIGVKIGLDKYVLRAMADVLLNTGFDPFSLTLGAVLERHVLPGPLSVYWGPSVRMGFTTIFLDKTDANNWNQLITWEILSAGVVCGIELFIFDFLSIFAEYNLAVTLGMDFEIASVAGSLSSTSVFTYKLDLGLGNNAMLGIVVYFTRKKR
jgi:hypothetical protein